MEFSRLRFLRKLSIGGWAVLEWRTFTFRRDLATRLFTEITSLEWLSHEAVVEGWGHLVYDTAALVRRLEQHLRNLSRCQDRSGTSQYLRLTLEWIR